jgi:hypothetical protein
VDSRPRAERRDREAEKAAHERTIFEEFAQTAGLPVRAGSIVSQKYPSPDLACEIEGQGIVAFELVRLVDQGWAQGTEVMFRSNELTKQFVDGLTGGQGAEFRRKYSNAMIGLEFAEAASLRDREAILPPLIAELLALPDGTTGSDVDLSEGVARVVSRASIDRGRFDGPQMEATFAAAIGDPTLDRVRDKLVEGKYETEHPIELLAYTDGFDLLLPYDVWLPKFEGPLRGLLERSKFRQLWVYNASDDERKRGIKLRLP